MEFIGDLSIEITTEFKDNVFDKKLSATNPLDREALKHLKYTTDMPVVRNYAMIGSCLTEFIVQTFEKGKEFSIVNLN